MLLTVSEKIMWDTTKEEVTQESDDREINERYTRGEGRIVIETNREKLPGFIEAMKKPHYMDLCPFYQRRPRWHAAIGDWDMDDTEAALFKICERYNAENNAFRVIPAGKNADRAMIYSSLRSSRGPTMSRLE
jgi:hypothetical protein